MPTGQFFTSRHLIPLVLAALLLFSIAPASTQEPQQWVSFERLANYPYRSLDDLKTVNARIRSLMGHPYYDNENGMAALAKLDAFTSPERRGETVWVEVYATSDNPAVLRLKNEVRLPAPRGGAIIRLYGEGSTMPGAISSVFSPQTAGVTVWSRYIAIDAKDRSQAEIDNIVSHELVHAYIISILGIDARKVPIWFHEGAALWLSGGKRVFASPPSYSGKRISYSTRQYNNFLTVFEYLESQHGEAELNRFIKDSVEGQSIAGPLKRLEGNVSYDQLQTKALDWRKSRQLRDTFLMAVPVFSVALFFWVRGIIRRPAEKQALEMVQTAASYAHRGLVEDADDLLKMAEQTAPWSSLVRKFIRRVRFEYHL